MNRTGWTIICLAYAVGLLSTGILGFPHPNFSWQHWGIIAAGWGCLAIVAAIALPHFWRLGPRWWLWLAAGGVAILAAGYLELRVPQPSFNDISQILTKVEDKSGSLLVTVTGKVLQQPRLTRSQRVQFWLQAQQVKQTDNQQSQDVTGNLYVTVPLLQGTGIYPGQELGISGIIYRPKPASNPGAFDFQAYLAREGAFAGLKGVKTTSESENQPAWGWWRLRKRILRSQVHWLGSPEGPLLSSIVLGRKAVDLPYDIRDRFMEAGLAHVLAASGFHVSLLLGVILVVTRGFSSRTQLIVGVSTLIIYIGLTGVQASVMRAALMGFGALIALLMDRQVKNLGSLLLAATILLLFNPLWIWDLGFQLSFLATLGLIVTAPVLQRWLDWFPLAIASAVAIPIAASIWTLPLLMHIFFVVPSYSVITNILTVPLIVVISLGGMISALAALFVPMAGSAIAWLLYYPIHWLIAIVTFFTQLPGSSVAVGKLPLGLMVTVYALMGLVWFSSWWQKRWWLVGLTALTLLIVPLTYQQLTRVQVTVLAVQQEPVVVIQDRGKIVLINSGDADTATYTVLPFLRQQGINQIDLAVALETESSPSEGWSKIADNLTIKDFFQLAQTNKSSQLGEESLILSPDKRISLVSTTFELISAKPPVLQLQLQDRKWWLVGENQSGGNLLQIAADSSPQVIIASGKSWNSQWLNKLTPKVAIATSSRLETKVQQRLEQKQVQFYWTKRDGAIQWLPQVGFRTIFETTEQDNF